MATRLGGLFASEAAQGPKLNPVIEALVEAGEFSHRGKRYLIAHSTSVDTASGAVPSILDRQGAAGQYPARWIHGSVEEAVGAIAGLAEEGWAAEQIIAADHAADWSPQTVLPMGLETLERSQRGGSLLDGLEPDRALFETDRQG